MYVKVVENPRIYIAEASYVMQLGISVLECQWHYKLPLLFHCLSDVIPVIIFGRQSVSSPSKCANMQHDWTKIV